MESTTNTETSVVKAEATSVPQFQVAIFMVGEEYFALKISYTQEILLPHKITAVPMAPAIIKGIMNLRGKIITVISLSTLFHLSEKSQDEETRIIVLPFSDTTRLGLWVDKVIGIKFFPEDSIEKTSDILIHKIEEAELVTNALNDNGMIINLLDYSKFLPYLENYNF